MKMVLARLKILILKEHLSIFVMTMALMRMKHTCMGIGSIWHTKIFLAMKSRKQKRSPSDNLTRWIIAQSKGFTKKGIEKISRPVRAYICLVLTPQVQVISSIVGSSRPAVGSQQVFKSMFKALINKDYSIAICIGKYHGMLEHAL